MEQARKKDSCENWRGFYTQPMGEKRSRCFPCCVWSISPLGVSPFPHSNHKLPSEMPPHSTQLALPGFKHKVPQKREKPNKTSSTAGLPLECLFVLQGDFPRLLEANVNQLNSDYWRAKAVLIVPNWQPTVTWLGRKRADTESFTWITYLRNF